MRSDKKGPLKSEKKSASKIQKKGTIGYNKKSALLEDAITQMNAGKYGRASAALKDLLALDPLNAEARRLFATLHLRLGSLMSARTAFESLAREALERQDYWLAESLLREYLTAGPRCVPFLEMLGQLYEGKGDVMAAVAEYGKAVEVLLEDPDSDRPNQASELFGKIRSLAPGSPVAFRLAAMFDTVTGQMVQAAPQPTVNSQTDPPHTSSCEEAPVGLAPALAMPWEQMESAPADPEIAREGEIPAIECSTGTASSAPFALADSPAESLKSALASDSEPARQIAGQDTSSSVRLTSESFTSNQEPTVAHPGASQDETTAETSSALSTQTVLGDLKPSLEVLAEASGQLIAGEPMGVDPTPVGQEEEVTPPVAKDLVAELPSSAGQDSMSAGEGDPADSLLAEAQQSAVDGRVEENGKDLTEETLATSASPQKVDAADQLNMAATDTAGTGVIERDIDASVWGQTDPMPAISKPMPSKIEVLKTSSPYPIAESPLSPAAMPWDQIEEAPEVYSPLAAAEPFPREKAEEASASSPPGTVVEAAAVPESRAASDSPFTSSSGLSWEDILAAVAAMQASPPYPESNSTAQNDPITESVLTDESSTSRTERSEVDWLSHPTPMSESFGNLPIDSGPTLSAPMPWEQIEVEDVTILRPDPEPEFGLLSADAANGAQDSTLLMPPVEEVYEPEPAPSPDLCVVSPDQPVEPPTNPLSIHDPPEAANPLEPVESVSEAEHTGDIAPAPVLTIDLGTQQLFQNDRSEGIEPQETETHEVLAEPFAEQDGTASAKTPLISSHLLEETEPLREQIEPQPLLPQTEVELPVTSVAESDAIRSATWDTRTRPAVPAAEFNVVADQPVLEPDLLLKIPEAISTVGDTEQETEFKNARLPEQKQVDASELMSGDAAEFLSNGPPEEITSEPVSTQSAKIDSPFTTTPVNQCSDETDQAVAEATAPAAPEPVSSEPTGGDQQAATALPDAPQKSGIRILWNDSFSKRVSSGSTGNMVTRWLKRTPDIAPENDDQSTMGTQDSAELERSCTTPTQKPDEITSQPEYPLDRLVDAAPHPIQPDSPLSRPTKPVVTPVWHRITQAVSSAIGAGVSTTRSIIVLAGALLTMALAGLAGGLGLMVVAWLILEEEPTPSYRSMTTEPQQTLGDSQKNGYFLLLGFGAAPAQDPIQAGMDRRIEEADRAASRGCMGAEGSGSGGQGASGEVVSKWFQAADPAAQMRAESVGVRSWVSQAGIGMGRYRQWLSKPFDDRGFGLAISPNCGAILYAHRLYVAEGFAQDVEAGIVRLEADLTAWRTVFGQAKTMPVKMMAGDALNDDLAVVSGLLLRPDLDDRTISRLAKLVKPLESGEQSIRWPMQSEFVLATKTLGEALKHDPADARPFYGSVAAALPLPKQRRFNAYAQYYEAVSKAAAEGRYADLPKLSHFMHTAPYGVLDVFVNPIESLVGIEPLPTWEMFGGRVLETEARFRLTSLQAWLRRTSPEQDLLTRVAKAGQGLYDPFTGYPMLVNMKKGVFYSVGRDMKDNEAQGRFDIVAQIPPTALTATKPVPTMSSR